MNVFKFVLMNLYAKLSILPEIKHQNGMVVLVIFGLCKLTKSIVLTHRIDITDIADFTNMSIIMKPAIVSIIELCQLCQELHCLLNVIIILPNVLKHVILTTIVKQFNGLQSINWIKYVV
jgi:hypothetical protein